MPNALYDQPNGQWARVGTIDAAGGVSILRALGAQSLGFTPDMMTGGAGTPMTFSRASKGWDVDANGNLFGPYAIDEPRMPPGRLVTNLTTNPRALGATPGIVGSGGVAPTGWFGFNAGAGMQCEIIGTTVEQGVPLLLVRFFGTPTINNARLAFDPQVALNNGDVYSGSVYARRVAGNPDTASLRMNMPDESGANIVWSASLTRYMREGKVVSSTPGRPEVRLSYVIGNPYDFTLAIGGPQWEKYPTTGKLALPPAGTTGVSSTYDGPADTPILIEGQTTNQITNPIPVAANGGVGNAPTNWGLSAVDASVNALASVVYVGQVVINGMLCQLVRLTTGGSALTTGIVSRISPGSVAATAAMGMTAGMSVSVYAGSLANISSVQLRMPNSSTVAQTIAVDGTLRRFSIFFPFAADQASVAVQLQANGVAGQPVDVTFAIGGPQAVNGQPFMSPIYPDAGVVAASTLAADNLKTNGAAGFASIFGTLTTNLLLRSQELTSAPWVGGTYTADAAAAPDGSMTAEQANLSTTANQTSYQEFTCVPGQTYTYSFYGRLGTLAASDFKYAVYDTTNVAFINQVITFAGLSGAWSRTTFTFTAPAGCTTARVYAYRTSPVTAGTIFLWGFQVEAGTVATQYVPTAAAQVAAGAAEGVFIADVTFNGLTPANQFVFELSDGSYGNRFFLYLPAGSNQMQVLRFLNGVATFSGVAAGVITPGVKARIGVRWSAANGIDLAVNGNAVLNMTGPAPSTNMLQLGNGFDLSSAVDGRIAVYGSKKRPNDANFATAVNPATPTSQFSALIGA